MTMIELIVVLAIVGVVSSVLIFNYSKFRTTVTLRGLSQDIALSIRKAQTYATSVRAIEGSGLDTTSFPGYGIAFSVDSPPDTPSVPGRARFILFADVSDSGTLNGKYDDGGSCGNPIDGNECVESFSITTPDRIVRLCTEDGCVVNGEIDVVFDRPAPDARICVIDESGACDTDRPSYLHVVVQAPTGEERVITIWNTGQISVE